MCCCLGNSKEEHRQIDLLNLVCCFLRLLLVFIAALQPNSKNKQYARSSEVLQVPPGQNCGVWHMQRERGMKRAGGLHLPSGTLPSVTTTHILCEPRFFCSSPCTGYSILQGPIHTSRGVVSHPHETWYTLPLHSLSVGPESP